jgi:hypothetical protein
VIFVYPHQGNKDVIPFLFLLLGLYVEFIGREKARAYKQIIYYKVKQWIQRELSHKSNQDVHVHEYMVYMVANLILLCSSKTYLYFEI